MKRDILINILIIFLFEIIWGYSGTYRIFTGSGSWKVKRDLPGATPVAAAIVPQFSGPPLNKWDDIMSDNHDNNFASPDSIPVPWHKLYISDEAYWISWQTNGRDPLYTNMYYWYYSPTFKIYSDVSRATIWISSDDYVRGAILRRLSDGAGFIVPIVENGYHKLKRIDLTDLFRSHDDGDTYQLEFHIENISAHYTGMIAYISYDYSNETELYTYRINGPGWCAISMPFHHVIGTATTLDNLFPGSDNAYITYDGINFIYKWPVSLTGDDGDAVRTFTFYIHFPDNMTYLYNISGIPILEHRYLDYDTYDPLYLGSVNCNIPFTNPDDYPDGVIMGWATYESRQADMGNWIWGTTEIRPRYGYCSYPLNSPAVYDLPYHLDLRCVSELLANEEIGDPVDFNHTQEELEELAEISADISGIFDTIQISNYLNTLCNMTPPLVFEPPYFFNLGKFHKETDEVNSNPDNLNLIAYPSPFNSNVSIKINVPEDNFLSVRIYDISGNLVRSLYSENINSGIHTFKWDGKDNSSIDLPGGVYLVKAVYENVTKQKKIILLK